MRKTFKKLTAVMLTAMLSFSAVTVFAEELPEELPVEEVTAPEDISVDEAAPAALEEESGEPSVTVDEEIAGDAEWTQPEADWYKHYDYTISGDTIWLHSAKADEVSGDIVIPATVTVGNDLKKVGLQCKEGDYGTPQSIWYPVRYAVTGIKIEPGVNAGTDSRSLFCNLNSLKVLDVSGLDTSKVTDMSFMFNNLFSVESLTLGDMDTSKVTNMKCMFCDCRELSSLNISAFDTSNVTDMYNMFEYDRELKTLTLGENFKTGKVTDMHGMFSDCEVLQSLDVTGFNTSNVTDFSGMFQRCSAITSLDVSGFDTSKATTMESMFEGCSSLTSLDVSSFNTSNVTNMQWMFAEMYIVKSLDLSNFDTQKVNYMSKMFYLCGQLKSLDVSSFNTSKVTGFSDMFSCCGELVSLDLTNFDTSRAQNMDGMFARCEKLKTLDLSNFDTKNCTRMGGMFSGTKSMKDLDVRSFDFTALNNSSNKGTDYWHTVKNFIGSINWENYGVENIYLPVKAMAYYDFDASTKGTGSDYYDYNLKNIYYAGTEAQWNALENTVPDGVNITYNYNGQPDPEPVTDEWYKDYEYTLTGTEIHLHYVKDGFDKTQVKVPAKATIDDKTYEVVLDRKRPKDPEHEDMGLWCWYDKTTAQTMRPVKTLSFENGVKVADSARCLFCFMDETTTINLTGLDTSNVTDMSWMFYCCYNLRNLTFGNSFSTAKVTDFNLMFGNCSSLTSLDLSGFDTSKAERMDAMFDQCESLRSLDVSGFDMSNVTGASGMFAGCKKLTSLDLSTWNTEKLNTATQMFWDCQELKSINLSGFSTKRLEQMAGMFMDNKKLTTLDLRSFDFTAANNFGSSFAYDALIANSGVISLYLPVKAMKNYDFTMAPKTGSDDYDKFGNIAPDLRRVYYEGTREQWDALNNTLPKNVTIAYDYHGEPEPEPEPQSEEFSISGINSSGYPYTGAAIQPAFTLSYGNTVLVPGTDYTASYKNNKAVHEGNGELSKTAPAAGTPYIEMKLKGNYQGTLYQPFAINKKSLSDPDVVVVNATAVANGKKQKLSPTLYCDGKAIPAKEYELGGDWDSTGYKDAGTYTISMTAKADSSYAGSTTGYVVIKDGAEIQNLSKLTPKNTENRTAYPYTGGEVKPEYKLYNKSADAGLVEGVDYTVTYENNIKVGKATVRFQATADSSKCCGTKTTTFKIDKASMTDALVQVVDANGNNAASFPFVKGGVMPKVRVTMGDLVLVEGTDYKLSYKNNKNVGTTAAVTVTGKGNYKNTKSQDFTIVKQDLNNLTLIVDDAVYSNKAYAYQKVNWTLTDLDGKVLKMGTDYESVKKGAAASAGTYYDAPSDKPVTGTVITLTLKAKGNNYTGNIAATYRVIDSDKSIAKATVTLNSPVTYQTDGDYDLSESDLTVTLGKDKRVLTPVTEYTIVDISKADNAGKKIKVTIRGAGDYGCLKSATFSLQPAKP